MHLNAGCGEIFERSQVLMHLGSIWIVDVTGIRMGREDKIIFFAKE